MKKSKLMILSAFLVFALSLVGCDQTGNDGSSSVSSIGGGSNSNSSSQPDPDVSENNLTTSISIRSNGSRD